MNRFAALVTLLLFALSSLGCVAISRQYEGATLDKADLDAIEIDVTTRQQVLDVFGPPLIIQKRDFEGVVSSIGSNFQGDELVVRLDPKLLNEIFIYEYRRVNRWSLVLGIFNYFSSVDKSDRLMFFFGPDNVVRGFGLTEGTEEL